MLSIDSGFNIIPEDIAHIILLILFTIPGQSLLMDPLLQTVHS